jgi:DNA-binding winged helix-turn-helix (wHTH) protein/tetratricopeptide (TPR) repeat protein
MSNTGKQFYEFGSFLVDPSQNLLLRNKQPVPLHPKAFDTLLVLVQRSETVVLKDDLMKAIWPDSFVEESNLTQNIFVLRRALGDTVEGHRYIITVPGRGYRFTEKVRIISEEERFIVESHSRTRVVIDEESSRSSTRATLSGETTTNRTRLKLVLGAAIAALTVVAGGYLYLRRVPKLTDKDTVVLADFANSTGDPVFDGTLRQGLSSQLEQSPFLNLLSDRRIAQTLSLMTKPKDAPLTHDLAHEVCQRTASAAVLDGAIAQVGTRYLLTLKAINCANGESLASASAQAGDKNHVLDALGKLAEQMRPQLGESLASVQKYDVPLEDVTTPSLEALQAYSLGQRTLSMQNDGFKALAFYQRAVALDPNFASAYARIGVSYFNARQLERAAANIQKAYELRQRVSEREKLYIEAHHADIVKGDFETARKTYELWAEIYPRDQTPLSALGVICGWLGYYDQSLRASQASLKLNPGNPTVMNNLVDDLLVVDRVEEAKAAARELQAQHPDDPVIHGALYTIDFLQHDAAGMQREVAWGMGKPGWEDPLLRYESSTAAYGGHLAQSLAFARSAADSAQRADRKESAALYYAEAAVREALVGNMVPAKQLVKDALALARDEYIDATAALALALAGDSAKAAELTDEINRRYPGDTAIKFEALPELRAAAILQRDPRKAIEILAVSTPYELGPSALLYPAYFRGYAYVALRQGSAAVPEFQKIIAHRGLIQMDPIGALAHLGLGRAYALTGDTLKAKAAYQDFLTLWKDADPDIPILRQAKSEYAKLQ